LRSSGTHRPTAPKSGRAGKGSIARGPKAGPGSRAPARGAKGAGAEAAAEAVWERSGLGARQVIAQTVEGLGYELVDVERAARGLLRISIDRVPGHPYPTGESEFITIEDCEAVTRQLQYVLEVEGVDYARLEVASPGLDRPLRTEADYARFAGEPVSITLKEAFQGRKVYKGVLARVQGDAPGAAGTEVAADTTDTPSWTLTFQDGKQEQVLAFALHEVREARLVPVLNFKGRRTATQQTTGTPEQAAPGADGGQGS
jgi:ribosome maturation factor RimP